MLSHFLKILIERSLVRSVFRASFGYLGESEEQSKCSLSFLRRFEEGQHLMFK